MDVRQVWSIFGVIFSLLSGGIGYANGSATALPLFGSLAFLGVLLYFSVAHEIAVERENMSPVQKTLERIKRETGL